VWDSPAAVPAARLIHVYRTHGCQCVFGWVKSLEADGFVVRLFEYETLQYVRARHHAPEDLRSCHFGTYLGYFVEGHISGSTLHWLAQRHPQGRGVAYRLHRNGMLPRKNTTLFYNKQGSAQELSDE